MSDTASEIYGVPSAIGMASGTWSASAANLINWIHEWYVTERISRVTPIEMVNILLNSGKRQMLTSVIFSILRYLRKSIPRGQNLLLFLGQARRYEDETGRMLLTGSGWGVPERDRLTSAMIHESLEWGFHDIFEENPNLMEPTEMIGLLSIWLHEQLQADDLWQERFPKRFLHVCGTPGFRRGNDERLQKFLEWRHAVVKAILCLAFGDRGIIAFLLQRTAHGREAKETLKNMILRCMSIRELQDEGRSKPRKSRKRSRD